MAVATGPATAELIFDTSFNMRQKRKNELIYRMVKVIFKC